MGKRSKNASIYTIRIRYTENTNVNIKSDETKSFARDNNFLTSDTAVEISNIYRFGVTENNILPPGHKIYIPHKNLREIMRSE